MTQDGLFAKSFTSLNIGSVQNLFKKRCGDMVALGYKLKFYLANCVTIARKEFPFSPNHCTLSRF